MSKGVGVRWLGALCIAPRTYSYEDLIVRRDAEKGDWYAEDSGCEVIVRRPLLRSVLTELWWMRRRGER